MGLWAWFKKTMGNIWPKIEPSLKMIFSGSMGVIFAFAKDMAIETVVQISQQGLPDNDAKRKAFENAMKAKLKEAGKEASESEMIILREGALKLAKELGLIQ